MLDKFMLGVTIEYQSGNVNSKGEERASELIYGDIDLCKEAIYRADVLRFKDTQLAIAFRENKDLEDLGGIEVQNEFIYEVTRAFLPDVDMSHIPLCWFRHYPAIEEEEDKKKADKEVDVEEEDNTVFFAFELNMQLPLVIGKKKFSFYMHKLDVYLRRAFSDYWHKTHPEFSHPNANPHYFSYRKNWGDDSRETCNKINGLVHNAILAKKIDSRPSLVSFLKEEGYAVTENKSSLSISLEGKRTLNLTGNILAKDFDFKPLNRVDANTLLPESAEYYKSKLDEQIEKRRLRLQADHPELYNNQTRKEVNYGRTIQKTQPRICIERESGLENSGGSNSTHKVYRGGDSLSKGYNEEIAVQSHTVCECIRQEQRENVPTLKFDFVRIKKDITSLTDNILSEIDRLKLPRINPICNQDIDYSR